MNRIEKLIIILLIKKLHKNKLLVLVNIITDSLIDGKKLIVCGNGGSAADSQHFVAELVSKFKKVRKPLSAIGSYY